MVGCFQACSDQRHHFFVREQGQPGRKKHREEKMEGAAGGACVSDCGLGLVQTAQAKCRCRTLTRSDLPRGRGRIERVANKGLIFSIFRETNNHELWPCSNFDS